jgi:spore coat polysaccharide biosynthesis protein SpsF
MVSSQNIVAIIQARMGSTRLPGKVLMEIDGAPLLKMMLSRVEKSKLLDKIIVATSTLAKDDQIEKFCVSNGYECFRGPESDVLLRYYDCAKSYEANVIVRLTADCPLIDPEIIDKVINYYNENFLDYAGNTVPPENSSFPDGSDVEVFSMEALEKANNEAVDLKDREHVTFYFWKYKNGFKTGQYIQKQNWSKYRITIDYPEDLEVLRFIIEELNKRKSFGSLNEVIEILDTNPSIKNINSFYSFGQGW